MGGHEFLILAIKAVGGGALVVVFALIAETLAPKRFAGLFGAAPAVALVGLTIAILDKGAGNAHQAAVGMVAGSAGMIAYALAVVPLLRRLRAGRAAVTAIAAWMLATTVVAVPVLVA